MIGNPGPNAIAYSIFRNITYKPDQLQPVSNMIRTQQHRVGASVRAGEIDPRADRLPEEESRQA